MNELRPCPFCGNKDIRIVKIGDRAFGECFVCGALSRERKIPCGLNLRDCQEMAAIYWNKRPIEDVLNKRIRELEAELLQMKQEKGEE